MNYNPLVIEAARRLYHRRPEFTGDVFWLWSAYVRATIRASDLAFVLDEAKMRWNWIAWDKTEAKRFAKNFAEWLGPVRVDFRDSVRFLLSPKFDAARRKHWPRAGATWDSVRKFTELHRRDESVFVPGPRPADIEDLYFACAKTKLVGWLNRCPDRVYVEFGHTVGFTSGLEVSIVRIEIGDLTAIHGMPDDGRDRKGHPFLGSADLHWANPDWPALFQQRCAKK